MIKPIKNYIARKGHEGRVLACGILGGTAGGAIPGFIAQYIQRLDGGAQELGKLVDNWQSRANSLCDGSLDMLIDIFRTNANQVISQEGDLIANTNERYQFLREAVDALQNAGMFEKPVEFIRYFDQEMATKAFDVFKDNPTVSISPEGLAYAAVGAIVSCLAYDALTEAGKKAWQLGRRVVRGKNPENPVSVEE
ncbi:DUF2937 family protein [Candidatus Woesearchaeota archaeon]|jgi:hypothetical protein|nr:DUF2937 family protein [Candidatus Woesearchaeota archaeon]MBT4368162.1 DUF2937 family protein [Candidatus Woesearchaeota archaeon]MBT4712650.1 DUF2937 family protein [Candidatus Woesearchaeota archaeon]MBT6639563.1 DUF2937 family protein [Candidatus Woesearchaeota archaeon]MBT7133735.1 DUF2937 family protein [Candidatus Woesearchaeota archaeon]